MTFDAITLCFLKNVTNFDIHLMLETVDVSSMDDVLRADNCVIIGGCSRYLAEK